jgi:hypothetical protein
MPSVATNNEPNYSMIGTGISDFGAAASDLFAASADRAKAGTDRANSTLAKISGQADLLKAKGDTLEGTQYGEAASLSDLNARFTEQSTAIQTAQADRALFGVMGTQKADIAASGFGEGGSGGDILRDSASQGALSRAVLGQQGLITEAGYKEQRDSYLTMQAASGIAVQSDTLAAQGEDVSAQSYLDAAAADEKAATGKDISSIISGIAGVASIVLAIPTGGASLALGAGGMGLAEGAATGSLY